MIWISIECVDTIVLLSIVLINFSFSFCAFCVDTTAFSQSIQANQTKTGQASDSALNLNMAEATKEAASKQEEEKQNVNSKKILMLSGDYVEDYEVL